MDRIFASQAVALVDRIACSTEDEFTEISDLEAARAQLRIVHRRAQIRQPRA